MAHSEHIISGLVIREVRPYLNFRTQQPNAQVVGSELDASDNEVMSHQRTPGFFVMSRSHKV